MTLTKAQSRKRWAELRALVADWDPLGLLAVGGPGDEYDCLVGPLMRLLENRARGDEISAFLEGEFSGHFGLNVYPDGQERSRFVDQAQMWFSKSWPDSGVGDTPKP